MSSTSPIAGFLTSQVDDKLLARAGGLPRTGAEWLRYLLLVGQMALAVLVIYRFQIESGAFARLSMYILGGFAIHALLPLRYRLTFLAVLSVGGLAVVLGRGNAIWLFTLGCGLIGLCHLPFKKNTVALIVAAAGGLLALQRSDVIPSPWSGAIWPVLGSMFMFRLIIYVYDRRHGEKTRSIWETLTYFFMLPNVCFAMFPVVDYQTYRRSYYKEDAHDCYQTGIRWIARGLVQLLAYRLIYHYGVLAPDEVVDMGDLFRLVVMNWGIYLRVSGTFHVIIGVVRMFGFALPETHFLFFLSSSINDFWRRVNIYWKDFMLKVFYLPCYFKLRKKGDTQALVWSTMAVVMVTWILHSYQWYWLRGTFPIIWQDGLFWVLLGVFMVINTIRENKSTKARGRRAQTKTFRGHAMRAVQTILTFALIACLWSIWTCDSFDSWVDMYGRAFSAGFSGEGTTPTGFAIGFPIVVLLALIVGSRLSGGQPEGAGRFQKQAIASITSFVALLVLSVPTVYQSLGADVSRVVQTLRVQKLNRLDSESLQQGYYQDLMNVDKFNSELWTVYKSKPNNWLELRETIAMQRTDDFLLTELAPSVETPYKGATLTTNEWGMRDLPYSKEKPAGTWRAALLGASYVMGSGVEQDLVFESVIERRLNEARPGDHQHYEILNYSVGGYGPLQRMWTLEHKALAFDPDVAIYIAHENEPYRLNRHLAAIRKQGVEQPFPELEAILQEAGITDDTGDAAFEKKLKPFERRILGWAFDRMAKTCKDNGIVPVWVLLPTLEMQGKPEDLSWMLDLAREAGFETIGLFDAYGDADIFSIRVAPWDYHPNAKGHALIAERLYDQLVARPELFR